MAEFPGIEEVDAEEAPGTKEAMDEEDIKAPQFPSSGRKNMPGYMWEKWLVLRFCAAPVYLQPV